jgi:site-specific DNA-methyltransferase (adenine-specific)
MASFGPRTSRAVAGRYPTDVIYHKTAESEGTVYHATQKPVGLGQYLVRTYTEPGDVVLDNAFGSGSFLVSAALEKRNAIGIELNEDVQLFRNGAVDLIDVAQSRLSAIPGCEVTISPTSPAREYRRAVDWVLGGQFVY